MKKLSLVVILGVLASPLSAQWTKTVPNLLGPISQGVGAMTFRAGVAWAGSSRLWKSIDSGTTWVVTSLVVGGVIENIDFLDGHNGLITAREGSIYLTRDGGKSWRTVTNVGTAHSAVFLDSNRLIACPSDGSMEYSWDGGTTWNSSSADNWTHDMISSPTPGTALALSANWTTAMHLWVTTDYGVTWTNRGGHLDADCWSVGVERCNPQNLYVPNEEYSQTLLSPDSECELFVSHDEGLSWFVGMRHPPKYFCGSVAISTNAVYVPTVSEVNAGIFRSTDHGATWQNIGGPSASGDTRLIAAIDDNRVIAFDIDGSAWVTANSGGDSLKLGSGGHAYQHLAIRSGSIGQQVTMPLAEDIGDSAYLKTSWNNLTSLMATFSFDSSKLTFLSITSPAGWSLGPVTNLGNTVTYTITNVTGSPTRPLAMGSATFSVHDTLPGMTLIILNDLRLHIGQSDDAVCLSTSEDEMWGIEIMPRAGISDVPRQHSIHIRPNPFDDHITIDDPDASWRSIEILDVLGRTVVPEVLRGARSGAGEVQISTSTLPPATYIVICHTADRMLSFRMTKAR